VRELTSCERRKSGGGTDVGHEYFPTTNCVINSSAICG
jgi:hypothetical protein